MPAFDVMVVLFVFCGPGMLFWFFEGQAKHLKQERPFWILVAGGASLTLLYYIVLEFCGLIQLGSVMNRAGKIDILLLMTRENLGFYLFSVFLFSVSGFIWGRCVADWLQRSLIGKTSKTSWMGAFGTISQEYGYVTLYTKTGDAWWGSLRSMPDVPEASDVIVLDDPHYQHPELDYFVPMQSDFVAVPLGEIKAIMLKNVTLTLESNDARQQVETQSPSPPQPTAGQLECTSEAREHHASGSPANAKTKEVAVNMRWSWIERGED